jgi:hypothetical protein
MIRIDTNLKAKEDLLLRLLLPSLHLFISAIIWELAIQGWPQFLILHINIF